MKPLSKVEEEIVKEFQKIYSNLEDDDITKEMAKELHELHEEIQSVKIEKYDDEVIIQFRVSGDDYIHLYLERDEDDECYWRL